MWYDNKKYCVSKFSSTKNFLRSIILYNFLKVSNVSTIAILTVPKNCIRSKNAGGSGCSTPAFCILGGDGGSVGSNRGTVGSNSGSVGSNGGLVGSNSDSVGSNGGLVGSNSGSIGSNGGSVGTNGGSVGTFNANNMLFFQ